MSSSNNNHRISTAENILLFLSEMYERAALCKLDPFQYEKYLYYKQVREENETRKRERKNVRQSLSRLVQAGCVVEQGKKYRLSPSGWLRFSLAYAKVVKKQKSLAREGKRRNLIVLFDVPEKQREIRDTLRKLLYSLGFTMLQRSVFLGSNPDSFEVVSKVVANANVGDRVKLMIVDRIL